MGCTASSDQNSKGLTETASVSRFVTEDEKKLVRESWAIVAQDLPATGLTIFTRFFEMEKDFKKLFRRLMSNNETDELVFDSGRLERHANLVMNSLGEAVASLDDSHYFSQMLQLLGQKHVGYNVKPEMLHFLWPAIRDSLKIRLGDKFTTEAELAWKHTLDYVFFHMVSGMEQVTNVKAVK